MARLRYRRLQQLYREPTKHNWGLDVLFATADFLGVFDRYEAFSNALFSRTRPLSMVEINLLRPIFGASIPYHLIRVDERAWIGPSWSNFCYVSFFTINSWGPMSPATLVHELVHVWQYSHLGAVYIPRALAAQWSEMGYNYGGIGPLEWHDCLEDFNYEQQADLIEDAFRLANAYPPQWVKGRGAEVLPAYYPYLAEVRERELPKVLKI
ncbi:MAG: hypothetical protein AAGF89_00615 [Bacteroidota bacterium]